MAIVTMSPLLACGRGSRIEQITTDAVGISDPSGNSQARTYGAARWALSLVAYELLTDPEAGVWKSMLLRLRGSVNYLAAYDPSRPYPVGSLRGAPTLQSAASVGDASVVLSCSAGQAGRTLVAGDWLQIGTGLGTSQLVLCTDDAVADGAGNMPVSFEPPLRMAFGAGAAVTWERASAYFRRPPGRVGWTPYSQTFAQGMSVDLVESWS